MMSRTLGPVMMLAALLVAPMICARVAQGATPAACPTFDFTYSTSNPLQFQNPPSLGVTCSQTLPNNLHNNAYPACLALVQAAINQAAAAIAGGCSGDGVIQFGRGQIYDFSNETTAPEHNFKEAALDVSAVNIPPASKNRLVFHGSVDNDGLPKTTIKFFNFLTLLYGVAPAPSPAGAPAYMSHIHATGLVFQELQNSTDINSATVTSTEYGNISYEMTQGVLLNFQPIDPKKKTGIVTIQISPGFPRPDDIFDAKFANGRALRVYDNQNPSQPILLIEPKNQQLPWGVVLDGPTESGSGSQPPYCQPPANFPPEAQDQDGGPYYFICVPVQVSVNPPVWQIVVSTYDWMLPIADQQPGEILCVKSKSLWADPYHFDGTASDPAVTVNEDIVFDHVMWVTASRGLIVGINNVQVTNSSIMPLPEIGSQAPCINNSQGGPQIGDTNGVYKTSGNLVNNFYTVGTGDNAVAIFSDSTLASPSSESPPATASAIVNSYFDSSFTPPVLLKNSPAVYVIDPPDAPNPTGANNNFNYCDDEINQYSELGNGIPYPFNNPGMTPALIPGTVCGVAYTFEKGS